MKFLSAAIATSAVSAAEIKYDDASAVVTGSAVQQTGITAAYQETVTKLASDTDTDSGDTITFTLENQIAGRHNIKFGFKKDAATSDELELQVNDDVMSGSFTGLVFDAPTTIAFYETR